MAFTEIGVAMLSSVLTSSRAASVNLSIMRTFVRMRSFLAMDENLNKRIDNLEGEVQQLFKVVFKKLDQLEINSSFSVKTDRRKIGLKS